MEKWEAVILVDKFNLRHLRAFFHVAECGSVSAASEKVFLSQPAITQALSKLEKAIGTPLFTRKSTGMFLTAAGEILFVRVDRALVTLAKGTSRSARIAKRGRGNGFQSFDQLLTSVQLRAVLALSEAGNYSWAARNLGVSRPSIHRAINDIERIAGFDLFTKSVHGFELTLAGDAFRRSVVLAFEELRQGLEEIAFLLGHDAGRIVVGTLPLARSFILPEVINKLTIVRPDVHFIVRDGAYSDLLHGLRYGEIDILIGALRSPALTDDVVQESLYTDKLVIVGRADHPLAGRTNLGAKTLAQFPWVTPSPSIPTREQFEALFSQAGVNVPARLVESSSLILMRGLLSRSNRLSIISRHQISQELDDGILTTIDFRMDGSEREIGFTTRSGWVPTATQSQFLKMLREVCKKIE